MARGLVCVKCKKFLRVKKVGVVLEEGMPISDTEWGPYKMWIADLHECPTCGFELIAGFAQHALGEHFHPDYDEKVRRFQPMLRIDDCGGAKP